MNLNRRRTEVRFAALLAGTVICLYLCWLMLKPFIEVLAWSIVLVIVFFPVHRGIAARVGRPSWAAALSTVLVILTILLPLTLVTLAVANEVSGWVQGIQAHLNSWFDPNSGYLGRVLGWLGQYINLNNFNPQQYVVSRLSGLGGAIAGRTLTVVSGMVGLVVEVFFVIFTMYYLFRDSDHIQAALFDLLPLEREQSADILNRTRDVISASVNGVLVIAAMQGALGGLAFWALGIPSPLMWGVVMLLFSLVPMAGSFVVWAPAAMVLLISGHWIKALLLTVWGALFIGVIDNVLRPKLVGEKTRLHELLIFFAVLGGLQIFGVLGLILGPVIVAVTLALLDVLRQVEHGSQPARREPTLLEEQARLRNVGS